MICILLGVPDPNGIGSSRPSSLSSTSAEHVRFQCHSCQMSAEEAGSRMYNLRAGVNRVEACAADRRHVVGGCQCDPDDVDAPAMSDLECICSSIWLFSAGAETTRNAVAGGLLTLATIRSNCRRCLRI